MDQKRFDTAGFLRTNKSKTLGFGVFTVVVVTILIAGAIVPSVSAMIRLQKEISTKKDLSDRLDTKIEALSDLSQQYDEYGYAFKDLPLIYPANNDYSVLLGYLDDVTREYKFDLANVSFPQDKNLEGSNAFRVLKPQMITLTVVGSQAYLIDYLDALEELPMMPTVSRLNYSYSPDKEGDISFNIQLKVYLVDNILFYE